MREPRTCGCGCGREVVGRQRFSSDRCRKRAARQRLRIADNPDAKSDNPDAKSDQPGRPASLVEAVGDLLEEYPNTPSAFAGALRLIASQLDRRPDHSAMWGRFLTALSEALEHASPPVDEAGSQALWELRTECREPEAHAPTQAAGLVHCGRCCGAPGWHGRGEHR